MAYIQQDLDEITSAIVLLGKGRRIVRARIAGEDIEYGQTDIPTLRSLRAEIQEEINVAAGTDSRHTLIASSKGL